MTRPPSSHQPEGGRVESHKGTIQDLFNKKSVVEVNTTTITFQLNDRFCLIFRAYNEGICQRSRTLSGQSPCHPVLSLAIVHLLSLIVSIVV